MLKKVTAYFSLIPVLCSSSSIACCQVQIASIVLVAILHTIVDLCVAFIYHISLCCVDCVAV